MHKASGMRRACLTPLGKYKRYEYRYCPVKNPKTFHLYDTDFIIPLYTTQKQLTILLLLWSKIFPNAHSH